jgi:hypothetical protein
MPVEYAPDGIPKSLIHIVALHEHRIEARDGTLLGGSAALQKLWEYV